MSTQHLSKNLPKYLYTSSLIQNLFVFRSRSKDYLLSKSTMTFILDILVDIPCCVKKLVINLNKCYSNKWPDYLSHHEMLTKLSV